MPRVNLRNRRKQTNKNMIDDHFTVLHFPGVPKAVQSMRVARIGKFMKSYQPQDVVDWKNYIKVLALQQLGPDFQPLATSDDECIELRVVFTFPLRSSESKRTKAFVAAGGRVMHNRKPDVTDNLMKGLSDSLTGILWKDDAKVCRVASLKVDGEAPSTDLSVRVHKARMDRLDVASFLIGGYEAVDGARWYVPVP